MTVMPHKPELSTDALPPRIRESVEELHSYEEAILQTLRSLGGSALDSELIPHVRDLVSIANEGFDHKVFYDRLDTLSRYETVHALRDRYTLDTSMYREDSPQ